MRKLEAARKIEFSVCALPSYYLFQKCKLMCTDLVAEEAAQNGEDGHPARIE